MIVCPDCGATIYSSDDPVRVLANHRKEAHKQAGGAPEKHVFDAIRAQQAKGHTLTEAVEIVEKLGSTAALAAAKVATGPAPAPGTPGGTVGTGTLADAIRKAQQSARK